MAFALASAVNSAGTASVTRIRHRSSKTTVTEAPNPCTQSGVQLAASGKVQRATMKAGILTRNPLQLRWLDNPAERLLKLA
jgi:hypothetical protein